MSWQKIWNQKKSIVDFAKLTPKEILQELLVLNGFDTKSGTFELQNYLHFIQEIVKQSNLRECRSIFEIGCGAGAFLYALQLKKELGGGDLYFNKIGGIDYAQNLIDYARKIFWNFRDYFLYQDASYLKKIYDVDVICSFSVMHYFPNLDYAKTILYYIFKKAKKCVLLLDILDEEKKQADIFYKQQIYGEEYKKFYGNLLHLYYSKDFFYSLAKNFGFDCKIENQRIKNYPNSAFRFNVIATRS